MKIPNEYLEAPEPVAIGDVIVGQKRPKICLTIGEETVGQIIEAMKKAQDLPCNLIEWRADYLPKAMYQDSSVLIEVLEEITRVNQKPLIFTLRTVDEGGLLDLPQRQYHSLIRDIISEGNCQAVDIEGFSHGEDQEEREEVLEYLVQLSHQFGKKVIISNHILHGTPEEEEIRDRLVKMESMGGDIIKIAVMANSFDDGITLLVGGQMAFMEMRKPLIAIAMGEEGQSTRVCGGAYGSSVTFGTLEPLEGQDQAQVAKAPGQITTVELERCICEYYGNNI